MRYLAVAHQTSDTPEFRAALRELADADPGAEFVLLVPATPPHELSVWSEGEAHAIAERRADQARQRLEGAGLNVTDTIVGDARPYEATIDALAVGVYDQVVVSTFPAGISRWLKMDVVNRLHRTIPLPIVHVVSAEATAT